MSWPSPDRSNAGAGRSSIVNLAVRLSQSSCRWSIASRHSSTSTTSSILSAISSHLLKSSHSRCCGSSVDWPSSSPSQSSSPWQPGSPTASCLWSWCSWGTEGPPRNGSSSHLSSPSRPSSPVQSCPYCSTRNSGATTVEPCSARDGPNNRRSATALHPRRSSARTRQGSRLAPPRRVPRTRHPWNPSTEASRPWGSHNRYSRPSTSYAVRWDRLPWPPHRLLPPPCTTLAANRMRIRNSRLQHKRKSASTWHHRHRKLANDPPILTQPSGHPTRIKSTLNRLQAEILQRVRRENWLSKSSTWRSETTWLQWNRKIREGVYEWTTAPFRIKVLWDPESPDLAYKPVVYVLYCSEIDW